MKFKYNFNLVFITGLAMGLLAAAAQAFFRVEPPSAYGICLFGHTTDLINPIINNLFNTNWPIHEAFIVYPTLLIVGVFIGSFTAANRNKELKLHPGPVKNKFFAFMFGFLVSSFGLLWGSCPIRTTLLASYGNIMALVVLASIAIGVILACTYIRFRVKREAGK